MFWQKDIETMDRKDLRKFQLDCINKQIALAKKSQFYKDKLAKIGELKSLDEVRKLPFTTKQDLRDSFPYGCLVTDLKDVVRMHSSSGTTGNPTVVFHTKDDIANWANISARSMYCAGARSTDVFQNTMGYGLFSGGLGFHYGGERLGMMTIPIGPGNSKRQLWFMQHFKTTVVHILPSYALRLSNTVKELGIDVKKDLNLRIFFIGAEPHSEAMRKKIEELYNVKAYNSYGLSEISGPGIAFECQCQQHLHIWEDYVYPEIVDPKKFEPLPDGEEGELVLTTLQRQAMPLMRYRTKDLTRIISEPCACGRTHRRIARITARTDDMMIINGVNIFPIQIEKTILSIPEAGKNYVIELIDHNCMDKLRIKVEINNDTFKGTLKDLEKLQNKLISELKQELDVTPIVQFVEAGSLPVSEGKAKRVIDLRAKK
ncbi:phenylacetate--CoA ligase family protein [Candidatus Ruminimicrobiellum ovillum]|uniref:phenylacetate--CoA ligase family protein n=1 Tax=Candidatus Ruminimicrobiellum ovillum TaxID=1947927 RepID=UPI003559D4A3